MSSYISQSLSLCKESDKCEWQTHHLFVPIVTPKVRLVSFFVAYICKTGVGSFQPQHLQDGVSYLGRLKRKRKQLKVLVADEDHSVYNYSGARQSSTVETLSFLLWISCSCKCFEPQQPQAPKLCVEQVSECKVILRENTGLAEVRILGCNQSQRRRTGDNGDDDDNDENRPAVYKPAPMQASWNN